MKHVTVLAEQAVDALNIASDSVVVDCTFGSAGHACAIFSRLGTDGTYIGIDADQTAFSEENIQKLASYKATKHFVTNNFRHIADILAELHIDSVDAILADFGWRMEQFSNGGKGFSFNDHSKLLMTYGDPKEYEFTAHDIINQWEEEHIADILYGYGEERNSRKIAKAIVEKRKDKSIETAVELAEVVQNALPGFMQNRRTHPATKTFQALRIAVNDELGAIESLVLNGFTSLSRSGRMAMITFHSIEDRLVKRLFKNYIQAHTALKVTKKPIVPTYDQIRINPRARSAKLRVIEKA